MMCANCGCGIAEDRHDDERNILWSDIEAAAEANGQDAEKAVENMRQMAESKSS